jgi:hypothetical protein
LLQESCLGEVEKKPPNVRPRRIKRYHSKKWISDICQGANWIGKPNGRLDLKESNHGGNHSGTDEAWRGDETAGTGGGDAWRSLGGGGRRSLVTRLLRGTVAAGDRKLGDVRDGSSRTSLDGRVTSRVEGGLRKRCLLGGDDGRSVDDGRDLVVAGCVDNGLVDAGGGSNVDRGGRLGRNLRLSGRGSNNDLGRGMGAQRAVGHCRVALSESDNPGSGRGEGCGIQRSRRSVVLSSGDRGASGGNEDASVVHCDCFCLKRTVVTMKDRDMILVALSK